MEFASEAAVEVLDRQRAEAYDLADANQDLFPNRFLNRDGTYSVARETGEGQPALTAIADPAGAAAADSLVAQLKGLAVGLEFTGQPPVGQLAASISPFTLGEPMFDDAGEVEDYDVSDVFAYGTDTISVLFDYSGMQDGQEVVFKMYIDGEEDPSWRFVDAWSLGAGGAAEIPLSLAYSNTAVFDPGEYTVEMYVASHLAQRGTFWVQE